ncbi:hypothetical protein [Lysobacter sp. HA35]
MPSDTRPEVVKFYHARRPEARDFRPQNKYLRVEHGAIQTGRNCCDQEARFEALNRIAERPNTG